VLNHLLTLGIKSLWDRVKKEKDLAWEISGSTITLVSNNKSPRWKFLETLNNNKLSNNLYKYMNNML